MASLRLLRANLRPFSTHYLAPARKYSIPSRPSTSTTPAADDEGSFAMLNTLLIEAQAPPPRPPVTTSAKPFDQIHPTLDIPPAEDPLLQYFTTSIMHDGHRHRASRTTARVLLHIHALTRAPPLPILREAVRIASPSVRMLTQRRGGKSIYRPTALGERQRTRYAVQWIKDACWEQPGRTLEERLARELVAVIKGSSKALSKKAEVHKMAMVNRGNIKV